MRIISFFYALNWPISMPPIALLEAACALFEATGREENAEWSETGSTCFFATDSVKLPLGYVAAISTGKFFLKNLLGFTCGFALVVLPRGTTSGGNTLSSFLSSPALLTFYSSAFVRTSENFLLLLKNSSSLRLWASATYFSVLSRFELVSRLIFDFVICLIFCCSSVSS